MTSVVRGPLLAAVLGCLAFALADPGSPGAHAAELEYLAAPSRLDPRLRSFVRQYEEALAGRVAKAEMKSAAEPMFGAGVVSLAAGGRLTVDCLVKIDDEAALTTLSSMGLVPRTRAGNIVTLDIPVEDLSLLEDMAGIRHVEMSRPLKPLLDVSRVLTQASDVNGSFEPPYMGYTGRNVVMGIVDTGVDLQHGDFKDGSGMTRIEAIWDQTNPAGPAPAGFSYGREWTEGQINSGLATQSDGSGHGTHVIGIAAGDGSDTGNGQPAFQYVGVAPECDIIGVKTNFTTGGVADGVAYIFSKAGVRDAVVNLSLGTQDGPHDGSSLFDQGLSALVGTGRSIVAAGGNEGNAGAHARLMVMATGDSAVFTFRIPNYTPNPGGTTQQPNDFVVVDGWYEGTDNFSFRVESPNGKRTTEVLIGSNNSGGRCLPAAGGVGADGRSYVENAQTAPDNNDREIYIELTEGSISGTACGVPRAGLWKIIAYKKAGSTGPGKIDFWIANYLLGGSNTFPEFEIGNSNDYLIGSPASASGIISVGAFISRRQWPSELGPRQYSTLNDTHIGQIANFSSPGPLRNDELAPIISAPGMGIASTRSAVASLEAAFNINDGKHTINQGTSQAAPHVAGVIALIFERYPHETAINVRNRLINSATHDTATGGTPNNIYGNGKLNAVGAMNFDTPVFLSTFEALPAEGGVALRWLVDGDDPFVGFHVSRADAEAGPFARLTVAPLTGGPEFAWKDDALEPGREFWYLLEAIESNGTLTTFGPLAVKAGAPRLTLRQNGPNPFASGTTIEFTLPAPTPVHLRVFDLSGRLVRTLIDGRLPEGSGRSEWDGNDESGLPAANGVYFYRLETASGSEARKMILKR
ncbi:MAG: S8 family serine peptidase [Candidatus Eisenbacteria bacterium]|nr:S8 family serine peptidase [Candidatus Eisenbacteria bacterium]